MAEEAIFSGAQAGGAGRHAGSRPADAGPGGLDSATAAPAGLAGELWRQNLDLARRCLEHPFVQGIGRGDLPRSRFAWYVGQDAAFLEAFARAYALAIAKAPDLDTMTTLRHLLDGVLDELRLHQKYAARWGVDLRPAPSFATRAYTGFLLEVAWSRAVGAIAAAMTPCMRLYAFLGQSLRPRVTADNPYREWVETYGSPDFESLAVRLEELVNRWHATAGGPGEVAPLYRTAMELEFAFFDAAWHSG
ncbi:transcriptional activator, TenA family [Thermaerobacter marianensis DSM 12885]|uniref:Aminopyrimidine aminohydrolase n=1 Tax=Thermaerobacter marianensis (strain ATCC 700841 / DSM 12885 / JCM 10246 / 7p75a) TaxID=644966 RepID=E6SM79_THEM7|nr:TenA family protein [Thermaerobacter marianensis]ADU51438.1 transcriptional activator, TenA family [Thermaerobacter marianensis DSM 12885]